MEWVSSTVFLPAVRPSTWLSIYVPIPRFDDQHKRYALDIAARSAPVELLLQDGTEKNRLITIGLTEQTYGRDIVEVLDEVYANHRGNWWRWVLSTRRLYEERHNTQFISIALCFIVTVIRAAYNRDLELNGVMAVLSAISWNLVLWLSYLSVSLRFRLESALVVTVARIMIVWWFFHDGRVELGGDGSIFVLVMFISAMVHPNVLRLLTKYSIKVGWEEIRHLF